MILIAQSNYLTEDPATRGGILAIAILLCLGLWRLIRWLFSGPLRPDPWSDDVAAEIAKDDAVPLCHRCLAPHDSLVVFVLTVVRLSALTRTCCPTLICFRLVIPYGLAPAAITSARR